MKSRLYDRLTERGHPIVDLGTDGLEPVDYPDYAYLIAQALHDRMASRGVAICGTGIGISIALNRFPWIRAGLCHDAMTARLCREHNDANVLALGARVVTLEIAMNCLDIFLETRFEAGRHWRRVAKLGDPPALVDQPPAA